MDALRSMHKKTTYAFDSIGDCAHRSYIWAPFWEVLTKYNDSFSVKKKDKLITYLNCNQNLPVAFCLTRTVETLTIGL